MCTWYTVNGAASGQGGQGVLGINGVASGQGGQSLLGINGGRKWPGWAGAINGVRKWPGWAGALNGVAQRVGKSVCCKAEGGVC